MSGKVGAVSGVDYGNAKESEALKAVSGQKQKPKFNIYDNVNPAALDAVYGPVSAWKGFFNPLPPTPETTAATAMYN